MIRTTSAAVFACQSKACAPPPVGTGGSTSSSSSSSIEDADRTLQRAWDKLEDWSVANPINRMNYEVWDDYVNGDTHKIINGAMRGDPQYEDDEDAYDLVSGMSKVFRGASIETDAPIRVYRRVGLGTMFGSNKVSVGSEFEDTGFISTSTEPEHTKRFGSVNMVIDVPKGTRVLAGNNEESELIFMRGQFVVKDISEDGTIYVDMA